MNCINICRHHNKAKPAIGCLTKNLHIIHFNSTFQSVIFLYFDLFIYLCAVTLVHVWRQSRINLSTEVDYKFKNFKSLTSIHEADAVRQIFVDGTIFMPDTRKSHKKILTLPFMIHLLLYNIQWQIIRDQ